MPRMILSGQETHQSFGALGSQQRLDSDNGASEEEAEARAKESQEASARSMLELQESLTVT